VRDNSGVLKLSQADNTILYLFIDIHRVLKSGGTLGFTTWKHLSWPDDLSAASEAGSLPRFPPSRDFLKSFNRASWDDPVFIKTELESSGFTDIRSEVIERVIKVPSTREYLAGFIPVLTTMMIRAVWNDEEIKNYGPQLGQEYSKHMLEKYGESFNLPMTAIVTTAKKP
jgi:hypothetical protein